MKTSVALFPMVLDSFPEAVSALAADLTHEITEMDDEALVTGYVEDKNVKFGFATGPFGICLVMWEHDDVTSGKFYDEDAGWQPIPKTHALEIA